MSVLGWLGSAVVVVLTLLLAAVFISRLRAMWPTLANRRRLLGVALILEFLLAVLLVAIERFVTDASWTWFAFGLLVFAFIATERQLKTRRRPPAAS